MSNILNSISINEIAGNVFEKIAPVWPLDGFVAVNPMWGCISQSFSRALRTMEIAIGERMYMPESYYAQKLRAGEISPDDVRQALERRTIRGCAEGFSDAQAAIQAIETSDHATASPDGEPPGIQRIGPPYPSTIFDRLPERPRQALLEHIALWCGSYFDRGQAAWNMMDHSKRFFAAWRDMAESDRMPEIAGLKGCRALIKTMPQHPSEALAHSLELIAIPQHLLADYFHRLLLDHIGWAGHLRLHSRQQSMPAQDNPLFDLLTIRTIYEAAAFNHPRGQRATRMWNGSPNGGRPRHSEASELWLEAHEISFERHLTTALRGRPADDNLNIADESHPWAQCVFCIDVRSERIRRALEQVAPTIQTAGFAGFFGFPVRYSRLGDEHGTDQFPVLLTSRYQVGELSGGDQARSRQLSSDLRSGREFSAGWSQLTAYGVSSLNFVEMLGLGYGWKLIRDGIVQPPEKKEVHFQPDISDSHPHFSLEDQITLARQALNSMGIGKRLARVVLFCGHGAETANNPYKASLDCGACGGHAGGPNARLAAAVLNKDAVRAGLSAGGLCVPADTWFVAGEHNTTTDEITIYDAERLPASHRADLAGLREQLQRAGEIVRAEKAILDGEPIDQTTAALKRAAVHRAADWAQVRPEWGLAGNAAFIAAPRQLTRGLNLEGRVFLHDYQWRQDKDSSILTLIMTAPLVVAHWINMQYYASTVCTGKWGAGSKTLHNVVGMHGVCSGNAGDLQVGLPIESLHDGVKWRHDPLRLLAIIAAPCDKITQVVCQHSLLGTLLDNQWIGLIAIDHDTEHKLYRYQPKGRWVRQRLVPARRGSFHHRQSRRLCDVCPHGRVERKYCHGLKR